ncbi:MAG: YcxB family protein [Agriterribacter sp.]
MQVTVSYKKPQVLQALRYHFIRKKEIRLMIILVNVFALFAAGLLAYRKVTPLAFLISSLLWFTIMMAFWWLLPATIYKRSATFKDSFNVMIEKDHFFIDNNRGTIKTWSWREFSEFVESPQFFHLYFDARSFFLLPKDVFKNEDDIQAARTLMRERIG